MSRKLVFKNELSLLFFSFDATRRRKYYHFDVRECAREEKSGAAARNKHHLL